LEIISKATSTCIYLGQLLGGGNPAKAKNARKVAYTIACNLDAHMMPYLIKL
jgi:hypothetical protein